MEPIQGNPDRREPILRKIASDSFFPNPLSPFRHVLCLYNGRNSFQSPASVGAGPAGEATYVLCRSLIVQMNT